MTNAAELFDEYRGRAEKESYPLVPLLARRKFDRRPLSDKIDSVMFIAERSDVPRGPLLEGFDPKLIEFTFTEELTHDVCQEAQNLADHLVELAQGLPLEQRKELRQYLVQVEPYIAALFEADYEEIFVNGESKATNKAIHDDILQPATLLVNHPLPEVSDPDLENWLENTWRGVVHQFLNRGNTSHGQLEEFLSDDWHFERNFFPLCYEYGHEFYGTDIIHSPSTPRADFVVPDPWPERHVRNLIDSVMKDIDSHQGRGLDVWRTDIACSHFTKEAWKASRELDGSIKAKLEGLEVGTLLRLDFDVQISRDGDVQWDELFPASLGNLGRFQEAESTGFFTMTEGDQTKKLSLYIPTKLTAYGRREFEAATAPSMYPSFSIRSAGGELSKNTLVYDQLGPDQDVTCIGGPPLEVQNANASLLRLDGLTVLSITEQGRGRHLQTLFDIGECLGQKILFGDDVPSEAQEYLFGADIKGLYHRDNLIRIKIQGGAWLVDDNGADDNFDFCKNVLMNLDVPDQDIVLDPGSFDSKATVGPGGIS